MEATADLRCALRPASKMQIAGHIEALSCFHPRPARNDAEAAMWVNGWLADLAHIPDDVLDAACVTWRRNDNAFMPKPGQLLAIAEPIIKYREALARRGERLIADHGRKHVARPAKPEPVTAPDPDVIKGFDDILATLTEGRAMP